MVARNSCSGIPSSRIWLLSAEGRGSRGPMKSLRVPEHVPSLIHCLGWTKSPRCFRCKHWLLYGQTVLAHTMWWNSEVVCVCVCVGAVNCVEVMWVCVCAVNCVEVSEKERMRQIIGKGWKLTFPNNNLLLWLNVQWQLKLTPSLLLVRMCALAPKSSF